MSWRWNLSSYFRKWIKLNGLNRVLKRTPSTWKKFYSWFFYLILCILFFLSYFCILIFFFYLVVLTFRNFSFPLSCVIFLSFYSRNPLINPALDGGCSFGQILDAKENFPFTKNCSPTIGGKIKDVFFSFYGIL